MLEMKEGKLKSGRSGETVTNPKQAIAIGLSEVKKAGAKVPNPSTNAPYKHSSIKSSSKVKKPFKRNK